MRLIDFINKDAVCIDLKSNDKTAVLYELVDILLKSGGIKNGNSNRKKLFNILCEREKLGSTGIQDGVAIPHGKVPGITDIIVACGLKKSGIDFESHDGKPSKIFFVLLAPESAAGTHLKILARLSKLLKDEVFRNKMLQSDTPEDLYKTIMDEDRKL